MAQEFTYVRTYVRKRMAADSQILCSKSCVPHPVSQDDALSILGHLRAGDVQVHGRWFCKYGTCRPCTRDS